MNSRRFRFGEEFHTPSRRTDRTPIAIARRDSEMDNRQDWNQISALSAGPTLAAER
jgi:hypothetical protein